MRGENIIRDIGEIGAEINSDGYYKLAELSDDMPERKEWVLGIKVRVRPEVENTLRLYAEKTGWLPHTVRNVAILVGLLALVKGFAKFPKNVEQYERLLKKVMREIERMEHEESE
jgi:hypothetical protein